MTEPTAHTPAAPAYPNDIRLPLEGVAPAAPGTEGWVGLTGFSGVMPKLTVNGVPKSSIWVNKTKVPMADGSVGTLKIGGYVPGFPKVEFNGARIFTTPTPPVSTTWIIYFPILILLTWGWLIGGVAAVLLHNYAATLIKSATMPAWARVLTIAGITLGAMFLGLLAGLGIAASRS